MRSEQQRPTWVPTKRLWATGMGELISVMPTEWISPIELQRPFQRTGRQSLE